MVIVAEELLAIGILKRIRAIKRLQWSISELIPAPISIIMSIALQVTHMKRLRIFWKIQKIGQE